MNLGVSYIPEHLPHHIEDDLRAMADIGCNEVLFALQENTINSVNGSLVHGARLASEIGLKPQAVFWGFVNTFGGGRNSDFMLINPDVWRVNADGTRIPKACLNNPKVIAEFQRLTKVSFENGFKGIFVDEPEQPNCFCPLCKSEFRKYSDVELENAVGTPEYTAFQYRMLGDYVRNVCDAVKEIDKSLKTITCVLPDDQGAWDVVPSIESLDDFGTDPYWLLMGGQMSIEHAVSRAQLAKDISRQHGKESHVWLNCWAIPSGVEEEIYEGGKKLAEVGCDSFYTWSFMGGLGTTEVCADPAKAWDNLKRLYKELSGR